MIINEEGIGIAKVGTYDWSSIDFCYFSQTQSAEADTDTRFHIKLFGDSFHEVVINANYFNQSEEAIKGSIETNCGERRINVLLSNGQ